MSVDLKQAYEFAKHAYDGFIITSCTELKDSWVFFAKVKDAISFLPPLEVTKSGEGKVWMLYYEKLKNCFNAADWLNENGKDVPIAELEKL